MTLEKRLEKLERKLDRANHRNRRLLGTMGLCLGIGIVAWAFRSEAALAQPAGGVPKVLRANRFVLQDENGKLRGGLFVDENGPSVTLFGEDSMATLAARKDGPALALCDESGEARVTLTIIKDGAGLVLKGRNGKPHAILSVTGDGPGLTLSDWDGKPRAMLKVAKDGSMLTLCDETGEPLAGVVVHEDRAALSLYDGKGRVIWGAP